MDQFVNTYGVLIISMLLSASLALSLYVPLMAGQLSLASPGFYAVGGYIAAWFSTEVFKGYPAGGFPIPLILLEMLLAGLASALFALLIGVPALRLRGIYLALATIAFVEVVRVLSLNLEITGGAVGIYNIPQPFVSTSKIEYAIFAGPILVISAFFVFRLERSRVGRALIAIREDELAAGAVGVNITRYKVLAFVMGAVIAGVVGAVAAHLLNTWNARQGTFDMSILILAYVLIGGSRTFLGPILGGVFLTALPELLRQLAGVPGLPPLAVQLLREGRLVIFGFLIVLSTIFFPRGFITPEAVAGLGRLFGGRKRVEAPIAPTAGEAVVK
jgi:branched-chain amino acid transport system permease protein